MTILTGKLFQEFDEFFFVIPDVPAVRRGPRTWTSIFSHLTKEKLFRLPPEISRVFQICQVDEQLVRKIRRIGKPTKTIQNERKIDKLIRFFNALAIYDLIMEKPLVSVSSGTFLSNKMI